MSIGGPENVVTPVLVSYWLQAAILLPLALQLQEDGNYNANVTHEGICCTDASAMLLRLHTNRPRSALGV